MEENFYQDYYDVCLSCSGQMNQCIEENSSFDLSARPVAELSAVDYSFAMLLGFVGALVTSGKNVEIMLDKIHQIASEASKAGDDIGKKIIKFLMGHHGDYIDSVPVRDIDGTARKFVTRQAKEAGNTYIMKGSRTGPHRIFWGHDIFSFSKDNPFLIMQKQLPGIKGIVQVFKHLTADMFSKQGLPMPTSSWWDYSYTNEKGVKKVGNQLLDYCNNLYESIEKKDKINVTGANNDIFNHIFSIHIQDIGVQKLGAVLCDRYLSYRKTDNKVIQHQFKLVFSAMLFYMNSLLGAIKYHIPYINWPAGLMMIKELVCMLCGSNMETRRLQRVTDNLLKQTEILERRGDFLVSYVDRILGGAR